ncbi:O-antigen ligase family protein, partial [Pelagibacteraceae bacterium]|nr:O-antigen ligase family protein [Pelagibacteraceae bacterium]
KYFTIIFLISFIFALIDGYFQYFNGYSVFGFISEHPSRMTLLLNDNMILGGYLSRLFPLLIALLIYVYPSNFTNIIIGSLLLVSTDVLIFITGERTALGLLFLSTILIITLISKYKLLRIITLVLSIIFISFISFSNSEIRERNIEHTIEQLGLNNGEKINMFSPVHDSMFRSAYKMFQSNPITGIGPNNFRKACSDKRFIINNDTCSTHPHNSFIQIMSETGLIGLGFLLVASYYILQIIVRHIYHIIFIKKPLLSDFQICLVVAMFLTLWPLLPSQNIFNNWINVIYYLPVGFYIFSQQRNKKINH